MKNFQIWSEIELSANEECEEQSLKRRGGEEKQTRKNIFKVFLSFFFFFFFWIEIASNSFREKKKCCGCWVWLRRREIGAKISTSKTSERNMFVCVRACIAKQSKAKQINSNSGAPNQFFFHFFFCVRREEKEREKKRKKNDLVSIFERKF